jgi:hypothetical protein
VGACEYAPVAPEPALTPAPQPASRTSFPLQGFTGDIALPVDPNDGSAPITSLGNPLPAGGWLRVRTSGGVQRTTKSHFNEAPCGGIQTCSRYPTDPYGTGFTGGSGLDEYGTEMRIHVMINQNGHPIRPRKLPGGGLEWLIGVSANTTVQAFRTAHSVYKDYCRSWAEDCSPRLWAYDLEAVGSAGVTMEGVLPLRIVPPGGARMVADTVFLAPGPVSLNAEAIDGIGALDWHHYSTTSSSLSSCDGQLACTIHYDGGIHEVLLSGRYATGDGHRARNLVIKPIPPHLVLSCPASVTRGDTMTCTAAGVGGALSNVKWTFTPTGGAAISGPTGTTASWGGRMVVGGDMLVTANVGTAPSSATQKIDVTPRPWTLRLPDASGPTPSTDSTLVTYPPKDTGSLTLGVHTYEGTYGLIGGTGPNQNWFANAKPTFSNTQIHITQFLYPQDQYYQLQTGGDYCTQSYLDQRREQVATHEAEHHARANAFWGGVDGIGYEGAVYYEPNGTDASAVRAAIQIPHLTRACYELSDC